MRGSMWWFSDGKNWMMLKARVLVILFLTYSDWIKWVSATSTSVINLCLRLSNWLGWIKLLEIKWNWRRSLMTFLMSLSMVLRRIMGLKDFKKLYNSLLGLGIIMDVEVLKWEDQWPSSKHTSVMLMILLRHALFLMMLLKHLYDNLSRPKVNELLHLAMEQIILLWERDLYHRLFIQSFI